METITEKYAFLKEASKLLAEILMDAKEEECYLHLCSYFVDTDGNFDELALKRTEKETTPKTMINELMGEFCGINYKDYPENDCYDLIRLTFAMMQNQK